MKLAVPASSVSTGSSPGYSTSRPVPAGVPGEVKDGPSAWVSATQLGDQDGIPGSCLHPDPVLAVVAIWGVN